mmetsp:Transcript_6417/g.11815  ORF Transcript_6417/g.11815 Transcript_6417/m.11815 type:complete len:316 (-) Transcript_6417:348-1295(-)
MITHAKISCSPDGSFIAFAHGSTVRLFNSRESKFVRLGGQEEKTEQAFVAHKATVRAIKFDRQSRHLVSCGDDKKVLVWDCQTGECVGQRLMPKKISAAHFDPYGDIVVADKTGDVYKLSPQPKGEEGTNGASVSVGPDQMQMPCEFLLGHCATVTDVMILGYGKDDNLLVATSDVEKKIRISRHPCCFEIESFCFGHKSFVTVMDWAAFKTHDGGHIPLLLSGAGDGSVRLWEPSTGNLLDTYDVLKTKVLKSKVETKGEEEGEREERAASADNTANAIDANADAAANTATDITESAAAATAAGDCGGGGLGWK